MAAKRCGGGGGQDLTDTLQISVGRVSLLLSIPNGGTEHGTPKPLYGHCMLMHRPYCLKILSIALHAFLVFLSRRGLSPALYVIYFAVKSNICLV